MISLKNKLKTIKLRQLPTYQYVYLLLIVICFGFIKFGYDNDFWFTINQGRYVLEHGFPTSVINSIHNLDFIYQSWGTGTLFYLVYHYLGDIGMISLMFIVMSLTAYFFYKLCYVVSKKEKLSIKITILFIIIYSLVFLTTRPHIFTTLNLIIILYLLESYLKTKENKYLYFLPLITLLEVNMHGIYYIVLMIIITPYLINSFKFKFFNIIKSDGFPKKKLLITYVMMFLTGFINPYGIKTVIYGFKSYISSNTFNNGIVELLSPDFHFIMGKLVIILVIVLYIIYFSRNKKEPLRYYLLLLGTSYLALDAVKSFNLFMVASLFPVAYFFREYRPKLIDKPYSKYYRIFHLGITICICTIVLLNLNKPEEPSISKFMDYLDNEVTNKEDIKLYTNYSDGSYAEYRGYNCYIDPRGEVFLKINNHKEDIFEEYMNLDNLKLDYRNFLDKYEFDYLLVDKEETLYYLLEIDSHNYIIVHENDEHVLYRREK